MEAIGIRSLALDGEEWKHVVGAMEFSVQQARIVELILQGLADKQIAREMGLSKPTVRTYLARIFQRTGCSDRMELALKVFLCAREFREKNAGQQKC
jgi:DNA-binding NarL/FixJ family response regulator